jgi:DNA helicase-2/ATP-dependent DNA helicase PcrA
MSKLFDADLPREVSVEKLNSQQRVAVRHGDGPLLVVAGAGTGKTRVITERIRILLESDPALEGESILGLTFTDKAAAEMKHRVVRAAGERGKGVWLSTFHKFCLDAILLPRRPELRSLDNEDHWILLRRNMPLLGLDRYRRLAEPGQFLGDFVQFFSRCQDELVTPDDYEHYVEGLATNHEKQKKSLEEEERLKLEEIVAQQKEVARVFRTSDALVRGRNLVTFGMQMLESVHLLKQDAALRRELQARYRHILVDEFQDTNVAQLELLWLLAGKHPNIVAVGDDDQAIYRFRGASFGSFTKFIAQYTDIKPGAGAKAFEGVLQPLTHNYRSSGRILRVAGQVIAQNERSPIFPDKRLTPEKPDGAKVRIAELATAEDEAQWVASEIERQHAEAGSPATAGRRWRDFAVLYRMHTHRDRLVSVLAARKIPFVIRNLSILQNPLVRDVVAYLRLIASLADDVACTRVLSAPAWGLEAADIVRLAERSSKSKGIALWDALVAAQNEPAFAKKKARIGELIAFINSLRRRVRQLPVSELFDELAAGLEIAVVSSEIDRKYLDRLAKFVREWEPKSDTRRLPEFTEYLDFYDQAGGQINLEEDTGADAVQLMTVHAAKGLEFPNVFILRLTQGGFPARPRARVLEFPPELMKEERPKGDFHIQEERRLCYVALTRAKDELTLTTVVNKRSKPSVFLDDILMDAKFARAHVERLAPKVQPRPEAPPREEAALFASARENARVYSRIAEWAAEYRPPLSEPLQLSASAIEAYEMCPQKYLFSNVWGIRGGPHAATSFGSVMHTTIKHFIGELRKKRKVPFEEVESIFAREWTSAGFEDTYQEEEYKCEGLAELRAFHAAVMAEPPEVLAQEKYFELPMEQNIVVTGRIDQVNRAGAGEEEIVDYKTGRPKPLAQAKKSLQLSLYALAAREVLDLNPTRLVFYNLQSNEGVATSREPKQLKEARDTVLEAAADIRAGEFPARPGFPCKTCEYEPLCPAHEQLVAIQPAVRGKPV